MRLLPPLLLGAGLVLVLVFGFWIEPRSLTLTELEVRSPAWPAETPPLRAVLISDPHIGGLHMPPSRVRNLVAQVNALHPDLVLLAGDYVGGDGFRRGRQLRRTRRSDGPVEVEGLVALGGLVAPLGVFAVMGNHDCAWDCQRVRDLLTGAHVQVLENQAAPLAGGYGSVWIEGVEDGGTQHPDFQAAEAAVPTGAIGLTLTHNPDLFDWRSNHAAIQLSGHTHGGQVRLPLVGAPVRMAFHTEDTVRGWMIEDGRILIVTRGLGESGLPVRLNAPPQIMVVNIAYGPTAKVEAKPDRWLPSP